MNGLYSKVDANPSKMASTRSDASSSTYVTQADFSAAMKEIGDQLKSFRQEMYLLRQRINEQPPPGASNAVGISEEDLRVAFKEVWDSLRRKDNACSRVMGAHQKSYTEFYEENSKKIRDLQQQVWDLRYRKN